MSLTTLDATFEVTDWDEQPFDDLLGAAKLTRAVVAKKYSGDIEGTSSTEWLMAYRADGEGADFVGLERIRGTISGRPGSLVLQHVGHYADGVAKAELTVVTEGDVPMGTGALTADPAGRVHLDLLS